jgi:hypothetical protein
METFSLSSNRNGVMPIYVLVQFCFPFREWKHFTIRTKLKAPLHTRLKIHSFDY